MKFGAQIKVYFFDSKTLNDANINSIVLLGLFELSEVAV